MHNHIMRFVGPWMGLLFILQGGAPTDHLRNCVDHPFKLGVARFDLPDFHVNARVTVLDRDAWKIQMRVL